MLPKHLNGFAFRRLKSRVVVILILTILLMMLGYYSVMSKDSEEKERQGVKLLQDKLESLKGAVKKSENSLKLWNEKVKKIHSDRTGLKVKEAKILMDELRASNDINNLIINLSNPSIRKDFQDAKFSSIIFSDVNLSFNAFNDIDATRFINGLIYGLPGHAQINSLSITAVSKIDDVLLANIASGRFVEVIEVKLDMLWQDIVDKDNLTQSAKDAAKPVNPGKKVSSKPVRPKQGEE